jgi:hypothetical protein
MHFCLSFVLLNILILNQDMLLAVLNFKAENAHVGLILTIVLLLFFLFFFTNSYLIQEVVPWHVL